MATDRSAEDLCVEAENPDSGISAAHAIVGFVHDVYREVSHTSA